MSAGLQERLPTRSELLGVFAATVLIVYTWTIYVSFWKLPSWLFFLNVGEILSIYSYAFLLNFLECLMLLCASLVIGLVLPRRIWSEAFVARGLVLVVILLGSAQLHLAQYPTLDLLDAFIESQMRWWFHTFWIAALVAWIAGRVGWIKQGLEQMADRFSVFLYVYLPLTIMGLIVVIVRIIW